MGKFEEQLRELEEIVARLESGEVPLEDSIGLFERGTVLSESCKVELGRVEARIEAVMHAGTKRERVEDIAELVAEEEDESEE